MSEDIFLCPLCKHELEIDGDFYYEDVCNSNAYSKKHICVNKDCELNHKSYWNDYGEFFTGDLDYKRSDELFPDDKYAAYNSISKSSETSIYKRGLKDKTYLSPWLTFRWLQPYIEHMYQADKMGNVTKKSYKLKFLKKDERGNFCIGYTSSISSFIWNIKRFLRTIHNYKKDKTKWKANEVFDTIIQNDWHNPLYKKFSSYIIKKIYHKTIKEAKNRKDFYDEINKFKYRDISKKQFNEINNICPKDTNTLDAFLSEKISHSYIEKLIRKRKITNLITEDER